MPSPVGHALAGATIAWLTQSWCQTPVPDIGVIGVRHQGQTPMSDTRLKRYALAMTCAALAAAPDLDLLVAGGHRMATHSVTATGLVAIIAIAVTGKVTGRVRWPIVFACTAAYGSHLLLDWLAVDNTPPRGIQILWPFSGRWFISDLDWFRGTARLSLFSAESMWTNALAILQEIATLGPLALVAWLVRVKTAPRLAAEMTGGHHAAK